MMSNCYFDNLDAVLAAKFKFVLNYTEEESHLIFPFPHKPKEAYVFINSQTCRLDMFCSTLHELGHLIAKRFDEDWTNEALAWRFGVQQNQALGHPVPKFPSPCGVNIVANSW